ncbi:MAG: hypothetical protein EOP09_18205 [Proteobacteria bacterium]|nr:MAG: hypothetical protein EOP09_18205 [Pseudomonadota bacterium]
MKAAFVFIAHLFSNIVFSIGFYQFNKGFELEEFPVVATRNYQIVTGVMIISAGWAGLLLPVGGEVAVLIVATVIFSATAMVRNALKKGSAHDART